MLMKGDRAHLRFLIDDGDATELERDSDFGQVSRHIFEESAKLLQAVSNHCIASGTAHLLCT